MATATFITPRPVSTIFRRSIFFSPFPSNCPHKPRTAAFRTFQTAMSASSPRATLTPVVICDVLDTLVRDPFFVDMHQYFGFETFDDFLRAKTPDVWLDFELGRISEHELASSFFHDNAPIDLTAFKTYLSESYTLLPGVDKLLSALQSANVPVHLCSNYPVWARLIEDSLRLSQRFGVKWTFVSAEQGCRKPQPDAYLVTAKLAGVDPAQCIMLDDRMSNCDGAREAGYSHAVKFLDAAQATEDLQLILNKYDVQLVVSQ